MFEPGLWSCRIDPAQFEAAILNLVVNARDAMPSSGILEIATSNVMIDAAEARRSAELTAGPYVMVRVTDTGIGMDQDVAARAFEPFFTTKEVGKGTGLGLSQVYGFIRQSGGHCHHRYEERSRHNVSALSAALRPGEAGGERPGRRRQTRHRPGTKRFWWSRTIPKCWNSPSPRSATWATVS